MRFELDQRVRAPLEAVQAAFIDPAFLAELGALPKLGRLELLEQEERAGLVWQRVRYAFAGELSSAVRAVISPDRLTWIEESALDPATHVTTFTILPDHYAKLLEASGTITLSTDGAREAATLRETIGDLVVHMPFVGRKVETAIVSGLMEHARLAAEAAERWTTDPR